jgi:hypothetical protein
MLFQETTPDTSGYMIAGYAIAFIVMGLYVLSLYLRSRNLKQDLAILEEMDKSVVETNVSPPHPKKPAKTVTKKGRQKQP